MSENKPVGIPASADEPLHVTILREMTEARANGLTDGQYLRLKLRSKTPQPGRDPVGTLLDVASLPKPASQLADEAAMRRTGATLEQVYAGCGPTPVRIAEEKRAAPRRGLSGQQKDAARVLLFELVCKLYEEPQTVADVVKRAAIALGISESEPTLPELTDDERRYCIDEAALHVLYDPEAPAPTDDEQALFDMAVDIHYERLCLAMRWSKATPDQRGPVIRRSLMRRMGL